MGRIPRKRQEKTKWIKRIKRTTKKLHQEQLERTPKNGDKMNIEITYNEAKQILSSLHETENSLFGFTSSWRVNAKIEMIDGIKKKIYEQMKNPTTGEKKWKKHTLEHK